MAATPLEGMYATACQTLRRESNMGMTDCDYKSLRKACVTTQRRMGGRMSHITTLVKHEHCEP